MKKSSSGLCRKFDTWSARGCETSQQVVYTRVPLRRQFTLLYMESFNQGIFTQY